jgi:solute carrier family 35 protein F5
MQSLIGIWTIVLMWPGFLILHYSGIEPFEQPPNSHVTFIIAMNMIMDAVFNILLLFGLALSSPLFVSVGTMLVMPATLVTDHIVNNVKINGGVICGCLLVALAFGLLNSHFLIGKQEESSDCEDPVQGLGNLGKHSESEDEANISID